MKRSSRWIALMCCCALISASIGCSSDAPDETLSGKITRNGQPLVLQPGEQIVVVAYELDAQGRLDNKSYDATVDPTDGSYEMGIGPGKYRISVVIVKAGEGDALKGQYSQESSPITVDVEGSMDDYEIAVTDG